MEMEMEMVILYERFSDWNGIGWGGILRGM
jgi:hypothetical protein